MTNSQKPENDLSSCLHQSTPSFYKARTTFEEEKIREACKLWQEKTGSLNMDKETQTLWDLTKSLNDDQQHAPKAILSKDIHGEEGILPACLQFPRGQPA